MMGDGRRRIAALLGLIAFISFPARGFEIQAVRPRIFTPNGDGINDVVSFNMANPSQDTLEGKVYDRQGSLVGTIRFPISFDEGFWDGKDGNGNVARAGVYIYEISSGGKKVTGTVVVAK